MIIKKPLGVPTLKNQKITFINITPDILGFCGKSLTFKLQFTAVGIFLVFKINFCQPYKVHATIFEKRYALRKMLKTAKFLA